jgi:hypothetical protein
MRYSNAPMLCRKLGIRSCLLHATVPSIPEAEKRTVPVGQHLLALAFGREELKPGIIPFRRERRWAVVLPQAENPLVLQRQHSRQPKFWYP